MIEKQPKPKTEADKWLLSRLAETTKTVTDALEKFVGKRFEFGIKALE
jgi:valyl-tRNA synthetase